MSTAKTNRAMRGRRMALTALAAAVALLCGASTALAAPTWTISSMSNTMVAPGAELDFVVEVRNLTDIPTDGTTYTITATLPSGLTGVAGRGFSCPGVAGATVIACTSGGTLQPTRDKTLVLTARVDPGASGVRTATFEVAGGGLAPAMTPDPVTVSSLEPGFGIDAFDGTVTADAAGTPLTQAGGHPYAITTTLDFNTYTDPHPLLGRLRPVEPVKDIVVDLPLGLVGDPSGVSRCSLPELTNTDAGDAFDPLCVPTSQVGTALIRHSGSPGSPAPTLWGPIPLYNMVPPPDVPARFGMLVAQTPVVLDLKPRADGDYAITASVKNASEGLGIVGTTLTLWGVPSDPSHDPERACLHELPPWQSGPSCPSGDPPHAFLRNPTACTAPGVGLPTTLRADSWHHPGDFEQVTFVSHLPDGYPFAPANWGQEQGPTGCDRVPFDPVLRGQPPGGAKAGEPSGFAFDLTLPQSNDPNSIGQSDLRTAVVTLPEGVRVSPGSADGLHGCGSAQIGLGSDDEPTCPEASKIGNVTIDTPLLDEQLKGGIYLATPFDNPFDSLVAIYLVARARGVVLKLPGQVSMHPATGQITTTFDDNPQLPFSMLHLELKSGPRAPLTMPKRCGTYTTRAVLTGWNGRTVTSDSSFVLTENARGEPCPVTFTPGFVAGTRSNAAGTSSSFLLRLTRDDEDQELQSITVEMPSGLTGRIADAVLCGAGQARAGTCGGGSRIGNVTVGAGAGSNPFYITNGNVHLTEGYKGAPFGLSIVVPAVAGPFDLGNVVVRAAVFVDRHTAEVRVVSDPLPTILQGIPLDVKDVRVTIDRDGFWLNPTSCAEKMIGGRVDSTLGSSVAVSTRFQATDCASLDLRPRMAIRVGGRRRTQRGRSTPLKTKLRMPAGGANLRQVRVTLPTVLNARLTVINDACTREEYDSGSDACEFARTGSAVAVTPLLRDPLRGGVYFVRNGNPLPDLFVRLRGQVDFDLVGRITIPGSKRLRTTFDMVPDVPVSMFALRLESGRDGSVGNAANLCRRSSRRAKAELDFVGQNGKVQQLDRRLRVKGCGKRSTSRRKRGRRGPRRGR